MNIGIFTYGTRGDVQPYIALALGLVENGHKVLIAAPENFKNLVEGYGITFHPLYGDAEAGMNSPKGQKVVQTGNAIALIKFFYEALHSIRHPLRESYIKGINQVDVVIANLATLPIITTIAEKQCKKVALTYFMPPVVPTAEFPVAGLDFFNFKAYNLLTYKLAHQFYWKFVKKETDEFRKELGLPALTENIVTHVDRSKMLDLYCFSPALIPQPRDWEDNHKVTGFLTLPTNMRGDNPDYENQEPLKEWLSKRPKPIYMGFGSNGVSDSLDISGILREILSKTNQRILFCTGWALYKNLPVNPKLFVTKYVDHTLVLPQCKLGIFHGGAGTLASMLRNSLPVIIVSLYTDQPYWGKIIEKKHLGVHIPAKKINAGRLVAAIGMAETNEVKQNAAAMARVLQNENGVERAIAEIEKYFAATISTSQ
jgi:sterol 3beta-glucosyltransferase